MSIPRSSMHAHPNQSPSALARLLRCIYLIFLANLAFVQVAPAAQSTRAQATPAPAQTSPAQPVPVPAAPAQPATARAEGPAQSPVGNDYVIGPGDTVQVFVWRNPELT